MNGPYAFYVLSAYGVSALGLGSAIALTLRGWLKARAQLGQLETPP